MIRLLTTAIIAALAIFSLHTAASQPDETQGESQMEQNGGVAGEEAGDAPADGSQEEGDLEVSNMSMEDATETLFDSVSNMVESFIRHLPNMLVALVVLILTFVLAAIVRRIATSLFGRTKIRESLRELIVRLIIIGVWVLGLLIAAVIVFPEVTPAKLLAGLGIGSVAIGFAFQDIFENFFAGVLILWKFPFENGDFIECEGVAGKVEEVTIRNTLIRTVRGELVVVPNSMLFKNPVDVLTNKSTRRISIIAGVGYDEDVDESREVIRKAVTSCKTVRSDPEPQIFANEFGASSVNFEVAWWTGATPLEQRESRDEVVGSIKRSLDEAGIEIPFPYRTLTFKEPLALAGNGERNPNEE